MRHDWRPLVVCALFLAAFCAAGEHCASAQSVLAVRLPDPATEAVDAPVQIAIDSGGTPSQLRLSGGKAPSKSALSPPARKLAAAAAASQTAFAPSQTDSAPSQVAFAPSQTDSAPVQTASKIAPNSAFIEAVEDAQPAGRGPLGPQPVFVTQAIIPELESPTLINPEPPPLFMPQNGPSGMMPQSSDPALKDPAYKAGSGFLKCGMPIAALDAMMCTPSATDDIKFSKELAVGAAFGQLNLLNEARSQYCHVLNNSTNPVLQGLATKYLNDVDESLDNREYLRGSAGVSARYDSDPGILPTFNAVGIPVHAPASAGNQYYANVGYDIGRSYNSDLTLGYSLYGTENYNRVSQNYNVNQNEIFVLYRRRGYWNDTPVFAGLYTGYQYMTIGGQAFLSRPIINPYVTFQHDDRRSTLLYGEYGTYNYLGTFNPGGSALDTNSRQGRLGVTLRRKLGAARNFVVAGGYQFQINNSDGSDYDFTGHSLQTYMLWNIPWHNMQWMLNAQYIFRDYSNPNSITGYARRDNEWFVNTSLLYPLTEQLFAALDVGIDENGSNVSFNQYSRVWVNLALEYRFPPSWSQRSRQIY